MTIKRAFSTAALFLLFFSIGFDARAQTDERRFEVTPVYTSIDLRPFSSRESGAGLRLAYYVNKYLTVEAEGTVFEFAIGDHPTDDFLGAMGFVGIKSGFRNRNFGLFAKLRPGVANFPKFQSPRGLCVINNSCDGSGRGDNRFALDTGGIVELYPTERVILRVDVGDTMIRFKDDRIPRFPNDLRIKDGFSHNLQVSAGIGYRF